MYVRDCVRNVLHFDDKWRGWLDIVLEATSNRQCPDVGRRERYVLHGDLDR